MKPKTKIYTHIFFIINLSLCIDQLCNQQSDCPNNSYCQQSYCHCNPPYILNCSIQSKILTSHSTQYQLTNKSTYFTVIPETIDTFLIFTFIACYTPTIPLEQYDLVLSVFVDTGASSLTPQNYVGSQEVQLERMRSTVDHEQCYQYAQFPVYLQRQPNGEYQSIIALISIAPIRNSAQIDNAQINIYLSVQMNQIAEDTLFFGLAIGIVSFTALVAILSIIICCYQRWKLRRDQIKAAEHKNYMIQHLKTELPEIKASKLKLPLMSTCSICLCQFDQQSYVRKLVCSHVFHSPCIDLWCLKNLNCPVCRFQLNQQSIKQRKIQMNGNMHLKWQQNELSGREQMLENIDPIYA